MAETVNSLELRVEFVPAWLTGGTDPGDGSVEAGSGTGYPVIVTPQELIELCHRVKDSQMTQGSLLAKLDGDVYTNEITWTFATPPNAMANADAANSFIVRGLVTCADSLDANSDDPMPDYGDRFFQSSYRISLLNAKFREPAAEPSILLGYNSDPAQPKIFGEWEFSDNPFAASLFYSPPDNLNFRTGFDFFASGDSAFSANYNPIANERLTGSDPPVARSGEAFCSIGRQVAFIDNVGNGNPLDPANELYLQLRFNQYASGDHPMEITTFNEGGAFALVSGLSLDIILSTSTVSAPLYWKSDSPMTIQSQENFRLEATEFWPYSDESGNPVWNTTTGARL